MKKTILILILCVAVLCVCIFAMTASSKPAPVSPATAPTAPAETVAAPQELPHSVLYYGRIQTIVTDESGTVTQLHLTSERYGEYVMNISEETLWIDSGNRTSDDPSDLSIDEGVYIFHSPVSTRSLPPQSAAFAVVRNIPQDAGSAMYHVAEAVSQEADGQLKITTDLGSLYLLADKETQVTLYSGEPASLTDIQPGTRLMAWYKSHTATEPGQTYVHHLMLLPNV